MRTSFSVQTLETVHHISHTYRHPFIDVDPGVCKQLKIQGQRPMEERSIQIYLTFVCTIMNGLISIMSR